MAHFVVWQGHILFAAQWNDSFWTSVRLYKSTNVINPKLLNFIYVPEMGWISTKYYVYKITIYIYMIFLVQFLENPMICVLKLASKKLSGQLIWVDETPLAGGKSSHGGTKNLTFCMSNLPKRSIRASLLSLSLFWWDFSGFYIFFLGVV
jgi:hypothetical protein